MDSPVLRVVLFYLLRGISNEFKEEKISQIFKVGFFFPQYLQECTAPEMFFMSEGNCGCLSMAVLCWMSTAGGCSSCRDLCELLGKGRLGFPSKDPQRASLKW